MSDRQHRRDGSACVFTDTGSSCRPARITPAAEASAVFFARNVRSWTWAAADALLS
jgi:hypothetical protein